jgi:hypothetical protein
VLTRVPLTRDPVLVAVDDITHPSRGLWIVASFYPDSVARRMVAPTL